MFDAPWLNRIFAASAIGLVIALLLIPWSRLFTSDTDRMLQIASALLSEEKFEEAGQMTWKVMRGSSLRDEATLLAARAGARLKRSQPSYRRQSCDLPPPADAPLDQIYDHADRLLDAGRIREAEQMLRQVLARDAHHHDANHNLAMLLRLENRFYEAQPYLLELYRQGSFRREYLLTTGRIENHGLLTGGDDRYLDVCRAGVPSDPLPMLNRVSIEQFVADPKREIQILDAVLARSPGIGRSAGPTRLAAVDDWRGRPVSIVESHPEPFRRGTSAGLERPQSIRAQPRRPAWRSPLSAPSDGT